MSLSSGFRRSAIVIGVLLASALLVEAQSDDLPAGPVQSKVQTACTECHDSHIIRQQRLSSTAWAKEVDKMTKWGALVDLADRTAFIEYLSLNFPADKAPEPAERVGQARKK